MLTQPAIGAWIVPRIERIGSVERRRIASLAVPGLAGELSQDLGRGALGVVIEGSLFGDDARDGFLTEVRAQFLAGEPVDFVADILTESELEQVLIESLEVVEVAGSADTFRYRIVLREYVEPPEPPGLGLDGLDVDLDLDVDLGLDLLDLPALLAVVPDLPALEEALAPLEAAATELRAKLAGIDALFAPIAALLPPSGG
jgi:hypothetical protein